MTKKIKVSSTKHDVYELSSEFLIDEIRGGPGRRSGFRRRECEPDAVDKFKAAYVRKYFPGTSLLSNLHVR